MSLLWIDEDGDEEEHVGQTKREYLRFFTCQMSSIADNSKQIILARPDLAPYSPHPKDNAALVLEMFPKRVPFSTIWKLQVQYSTEVDIAGNPLAQPAVISNGFASHTRIMLVDANGVPVLNTAGDLIDDPPVEEEQYDLVFKVEKNVPPRLPRWAIIYPGAVNNDALVLRGLPVEPGTLKYVPDAVGADEFGGPKNDVPFAKLSFELHYREEGWTHLIPNRGYFQLKPRQVVTAAEADSKGGTLKDGTGLQGYKRKVDRVRIKIKDENGSKVYPTDPQFLDRFGALIENPTFDNIVLLEKNFKKLLPFSVLPLN